MKEPNNQALRAALRFMRHDGLCAFIGGYGYCSCGMDLTRDAALATLTPDRHAEGRIAGLEEAAKAADAALAKWNEIVTAGGIQVGGVVVTEDEAHVAAGACEALALKFRAIAKAGQS